MIQILIQLYGDEAKNYKENCQIENNSTSIKCEESMVLHKNSASIQSVSFCDFACIFTSYLCFVLKIL